MSVCEVCGVCQSVRSVVCVSLCEVGGVSQEGAPSPLSRLSTAQVEVSAGDDRC